MHIKRFFRKRPAFYVFVILIIGFISGRLIPGYLTIKIFFLFFFLILFLFLRKWIFIFFILFLLSGIYGNPQREFENKRVKMSGLYVNGRLISPFKGQIGVNVSVSSGSIISISGKLYSWRNIKRLSEVKIERVYGNPLGIIYRFRDYLNSLILKYVPGDIGKLSSGVSLGIRREMPSYLFDRFRNCGAAHLLAISGLHTGIIFFIIFVFLRTVRVKRGPALIGSAFLVAFYAVMSGLRLPVIRASIMLWFLVAGEFLERNIDSINSLSAAGIFILIIMPDSLYTLSFQLSFIAVFSIIIAISFSREKLQNIPETWWKKWIIVPALVTIAAQIGTLPPVAYNFGYIPLFGIFANIFLVPLIGGLLAGIFLLWCSPPAGGIIGSYIWGVGFLMNRIMISLEKLPVSTLEFRRGNPHFFWLYLLLIPVIVLFLRRKSD